MKWQKKEIDLLLKIKKQNKRNLPIPIQKLQKIFPYRSKSSIYFKAKELGLNVTFYEKVFEPNEEAFLDLLNNLKVRKVE